MWSLICIWLQDQIWHRRRWPYSKRVRAEDRFLYLDYKAPDLKCKYHSRPTETCWVWNLKYIFQLDIKRNGGDLNLVYVAPSKDWTANYPTGKWTKINDREAKGKTNKQPKISPTHSQIWAVIKTDKRKNPQWVLLVKIVFFSILCTSKVLEATCVQ